MTVYADLRHIDAALGLPHGTVRAVERRQGGDYALILARPRPGSLAARQMPTAIVSRRVLRIPRRAVHGTPRRWRSRNRRLQEWLEVELDARPNFNDQQLDELRAAIVRASHDGELQRFLREHGRRAA